MENKFRETGWNNIVFIGLNFVAGKDEAFRICKAACLREFTEDNVKYG